MKRARSKAWTVSAAALCGMCAEDAAAAANHHTVHWASGRSATQLVAHAHVAAPVDASSPEKVAAALHALVWRPAQGACRWARSGSGLPATAELDGAGSNGGDAHVKYQPVSSFLADGGKGRNNVAWCAMPIPVGVRTRGDVAGFFYTNDERITPKGAAIHRSIHSGEGVYDGGRSWEASVISNTSREPGSPPVDIGGESAKPDAPSPIDELDCAFDAIHRSKFVDLTHAFAPGIPHWKGMPDEHVERPFTISKDGFNIDVFTHPGQWGTHVDPPAHFHQGLATVDQIDPSEFLLRLVVIDIHEKVAFDPDYAASLDDVRSWERRHGPIPRNSFVVLRTDWSKRWPDDAALQNKDGHGIAHYPGWSLDVLRYLYETRHVTATGHETTDTDPGSATSKDDYSLESYVLGTNHFQIELLANLDQVPEAGALAMVTFPKPEKGSGFPARVVAIVPR